MVRDGAARSNGFAVASTVYSYIHRIVDAILGSFYQGVHDVDNERSDPRGSWLNAPLDPPLQDLWGDVGESRDEVVWSEGTDGTIARVISLVLGEESKNEYTRFLFVLCVVNAEIGEWRFIGV